MGHCSVGGYKPDAALTLCNGMHPMSKGNKLYTLWTHIAAVSDGRGKNAPHTNLCRHTQRHPFEAQGWHASQEVIVRS